MSPQAAQHDWPEVPLLDICTRITDGTHQPPGFVDAGVPFLFVSNIRDGRILLDDTKFISPATHRELDERCPVERGDILYTIVGSYGNVAVVEGNRPLSFQRHIAHIKPDRQVVDSRYLRAALEAVPVRRQVDRLVRGVAQKTLNLRELKTVRLALPPLPEQRRIADILDRADAVRRKRQEAIKLTEEFLRSAFLEMFGDPITNPKGWPVVKLGEVAAFVGGGTPSRKIPRYFTGDICWATSKDMKGECLHDTQEHVTQEAIENSATKLVDPGCLLIVVKSKVLMHRLPVLLATVPVCFGQDLKAIVPSAGVPSRYVARHLRVGSRALLSQARGVNTEGLTLDHLRSYELMIPPAAEMRAWDQLEERTQRCLERLRETESQTSHLFDSLVQRTFRGEL